MAKTGVVTIRDVASESGYSASTVSIVLNSAPLSRYIPTETKTRIETAAKRLGYRPNPLARSLRSQHSNIVGVMVFDITDPFCTPILRGLENCAVSSELFVASGGCAQRTAPIRTIFRDAAGPACRGLDHYCQLAGHRYQIAGRFDRETSANGGCRKGSGV